jgi:hypothetical protein
VNCCYRFLTLAIIVAIGTVSLFAQTRIIHRWVLTGLPMPNLKKIFVIGVLENYLVREEFEDEMERLLAKSGVRGIKSYMVLPHRNEMMEGELKQRIKESTLDGVLIVRPKAARQDTEEVVTGAVYVPPAGYYTFWPYWNMAYTEVVTSSYLKEYTVVRAEFNLYNTKDEKLLWSGESDTVYSKDFEKLGKDYANMLVKQLKKIR